MVSSYHLTVKKYLDENRIGCTLPEHIQRGWDRIYTLEEQQFNTRSCIIGPDVQIPNSIVRKRLGTTQILMKTNIEILRKAFELPNELFINLSDEHKLFDIIEDDQLSFEWNDEDNNNEIKHQKSAIDIILNKQREKRRKYEDYKYDYDNIEPLSIYDIIEKIHTNVENNLNNEDLKLIADLMQIISRHNKNQIMNIYDELTNVQLISKFGGVPKFVQALQEIQKAFEQVAMKTNLISIETVLNVLLEKDNTYRLAMELLKSFNENIKKTKQQQILKLEDKSGDISDHDQTVFNILMKDRISRLSASDLTMLIHDFETIQNIDTTKVGNDRDGQVNFISEQLNIIFIRAHLDGIKTIFHAMKSSIGVSLKDFIDKIEASLTTKLTEHDSIIIESYIHDYLSSLTNNELKIIYERLAQQGVLQRIAITGELNQTITLNLMKKIDTNGLDAVIESMKDVQLDNDSMKELIEALMNINHYIQTQSSISLDQIQNQLGMAYFVETRNLSKPDIHELSKAADLYSIIHINLTEKATIDECSTFLEHLKAPFIRICIQRILDLIKQDNTINLDKVSNKFYNERIIDLINELIYGSDEFNRNLFIHQIKKHLKKNKELPDKLYRQMLREKFIHIDTKIKIDTDKKKVSTIINEINQILINVEDRIKQEHLVDLFDRIDVLAPSIHRITDKSISSPTKTLKERITRNIKDQLSTTTAVTSAKHSSEQKRSLLKSGPKLQSITQITKKHSKILDDTKKTNNLSIDKDEKEKLKFNARIPLALKSEEQQKSTLGIAHEQPVLLSPTPITTDTINMTNVSKPSSETKEISDLLQQPNELHEENFEKPDTSFIVKSIETLQGDLEIIRPETISTGKMNENKTLNFELNSNAALLFYPPSVLNDSKQEINTIVSGRIAEFVNDSQFVKTKAQRLFSKTIPTNIVRQPIEEDTIDRSSSSSNLTTNNAETISTVIEARKLLGPSNRPSDEPSIPISTLPSDNIKSSAKTLHRNLPKSIKKIEDIYINSLTKALRNLFTRSEYHSVKLQKIHEELITSGHISPLNEFYRSPSEALRVTLDHCSTYADLIKWTLSLLQTNNKRNLIDFGHDLYSIAIDLDFALIERIDNTRCAIDIQENLKYELQTITETDLREINSYLNASQLDKLVHLSKKLNVISKDRMISDLNLLLLHLIQVCHTFELKYRPMQTRIREIAERFKSRAVTDLVRKLDEIEKRLAKNFSITFHGLSKRMNESRFILMK
ncbi:unnamed protein product [Rotaria sordida]|uniref:Uncharacterized protein n=1 Tax=Rotaria sordida TaxID=392033 RepID=A0A813VTG2_9BILA|nr:unnamed protein product [Rotaria sordida]CAF1121758.1 unnamed protein product [Rotaria sordida]